MCVSSTVRSAPQRALRIHACVADCEAVASDGRVHIHAVSDIGPGEELFIKYGLSVEGRLSAAGRR
ncbi:SET domain-containing protein-lysine N-methyltransferase [Paraburkholderia strydomiana]|uniref:SET domain-containing protein-lysine N-methyltransferase n=1 Tax=Paraburkholderia strydomiana TaxID=1245417 RepID=UPI00286CD340|nr:SET domain-containing protein-lysine N-methyltransferase [Paraburkholderia strydomiana]